MIKWSCGKAFVKEAESGWFAGDEVIIIDNQYRVFCGGHARSSGLDKAPSQGGALEELGSSKSTATGSRSGSWPSVKVAKRVGKESL